jgi:hypothetical protein
MFLLFAGFLIIFRLFQVSLQYNSLAQKRLTASRIATKTMEEVRAWARDPDNYDNHWDSTYPGTPFQDPDESAYTVTVRQENHEVLSPCTSLEQRWVASGKERRFTRSFRKVTVTVAWSPDATDNISLTSLVGDPPRELFATPLEIGYPNGLRDLAPNETQALSATLKDSNGNDIPDVCFEWYVIPGQLSTSQGGNGIIDHDLADTNRSGRRVEFRNIYPHPGGWAPVHGRVRMRAISFYRRARQFRMNDTFWRNNAL